MSETTSAILALYGIPAVVGLFAAAALLATGRGATAGRGEVRFLLLAAVLWPVTVVVLGAHGMWWLLRNTARLVWFALGGRP